MHEDILINAGFSFREVKIYTCLLSEQELMASEISKKTGLIRTNVYDILNSLIRKGIVSYAIKGGKKYFMAASAERILDYIDSQKEDLNEIKDEIKKILPKLSPIRSNLKGPEIYVYEGKEGMKTILEMSIRESLKTKKEILGISVQQQKCRDLAGPYHIRWYNHREKHKIRSRYLMSADQGIIPVAHTKFKVLPKEAKNPNEIFIFGDITSQFLFVGGSFSAIVIKNKEFTDRYRHYFDFLWNLVK